MGVAYCRKRKLCHRDLKLENLLLSADMKSVKICDFGLAKDLFHSEAKVRMHLIIRPPLHIRTPCAKLVVGPVVWRSVNDLVLCCVATCTLHSVVGRLCLAQANTWRRSSWREKSMMASRRICGNAVSASTVWLRCVFRSQVFARCVDRFAAAIRAADDSDVILALASPYTMLNWF